MTKTAVVVAAALVDTVGAVVAEAEINIGENRDNGSGIDGDSGETLVWVVALATVDGNSNGSQNRVSGSSSSNSGYGGARQQQKLQGQATINKIGSGSGEDSSCCSGNCGSAALMAGRGSSAAEVTTMRAAATATTVVVTLYPLEGRNVEVDTNKCQINTNN